MDSDDPAILTSLGTQQQTQQHQSDHQRQSTPKKFILSLQSQVKPLKYAVFFRAAFFLPTKTEQRHSGVHIGEHILMPSVKVRDNEPFDFALRRFKRACEKAGILAESRKRQYYEKQTQERKRKKAAAVKRLQRRVAKEGIPRRMY